MPDLDWNKKVWDQAESWPANGDGWSERWGGTMPLWFGVLFPRLHRILPADAILEIAPGFGRWTQFLIPLCSKYVGVDLNERCVNACKTRFVNNMHVEFICNDGLSLSCIGDETFDFIFSYDSLVHANIEVMNSCIPQIIRKLKPNGVAFLHHSNLADVTLNKEHLSHLRSGSVSADIVKTIVKTNNGEILIQEIIDWIDSGPIDCFTTFTKAENKQRSEAKIRSLNCEFVKNAGYIEKYLSQYSNLKI